MQFNSYIFILVFLPALILGYYAANRMHMTLGKIYLIAFNIAFYFYAGWKLAVILGISVLLNHLFCLLLARRRGEKAVLAANIIANVAVLFYFKYFNFFLETINQIMGSEYTLREIILPLGISFFTFQQIMYVVNIYRGEIRQHCFVDYLMYILYFPKLVMGPLAEPVKMIEEFNNPALKKIDWDNIAYGLKIFSFGLFKKLIFADTFSKAVAWGYKNIEASTSMDLFFVMLFYTFEIYFDFSGYSDMAVGVSKMLNISLPMNFNSPYKAVSIRDFWKRWHMSLTGFFTKYVYIPLGGNKHGTARTYLNTMFVFLVSGIWHGANWTFILWGILHGMLNVLDRIFEKQQKKLMEIVRWVGTFFAVNILWLLFRSDSVAQWWTLLGKIFTFQSMEISTGLLNCFVLPETSFLLKILHMDSLNSVVRGLSMLLFTMSAYMICLIPENNYKKLENNSYVAMILSAGAFIWSFLCLSSESVFVYFNF